MEQSTQPQAQPTKKHSNVYYGGMGCLGLFLLFVGYSCVAGVSGLNTAKEKAQQNKAAYDAQQASNTNNEPIAVVTQPTIEAPKFVFDLEALYGKNIDEIRDILGTPLDGDQIDPTALQLEMGFTEWSNSFKKDDWELLVTYNPTNKKVTDFFLSTQSSAETKQDAENLKNILNVQNSNNYIFELVKAIKDPSIYTGIKVIPK